MSPFSRPKNSTCTRVYTVGKKVARNIGILSKIRHFGNNSILYQLYYSLIYPLQTYGLLVWGNTYHTTLKPIITLQKWALRIITYSKPDEHSDPLFKQLELLKLVDLVVFHNALFMYQYHKNLLPESFNNFFEAVSSKHQYNTRFASRLIYYIIQLELTSESSTFALLPQLFGMIWITT